MDAKGVYLMLFIIATVSGSRACPDICSCRDGFVDCSRRGLVTLPNGLDEYKTTHLDLSHNNIQRIPNGLKSIRNLSRLNLAHNKISVIGYSDMLGITQLTYLDLSYNRLHDSKEIKFSEFSNLESLEELKLSNNDLKRIAPFFSKTLKKLLINNCSLLHIDLQEMLKNLPNLKELNASNNLLVNLSALESKSLQILDLSDCNLRMIYNPIFYNLTVLQRLYIRRNKNLKKINLDSSSLLELDISDCNLEAIPTGYLGKLTHATLRGNHLRTIIQHAFKNWVSLEQLDLSYCSISNLTNEGFIDLLEIKEIDLSYNALGILEPKTFKANKKLKKLILSHNYFTNMMELESTSLTYLDVSACEIKEISRTSLIDTTQLQFLNLSRNLISSLPDNLEADLLYKLDISLCHITSISNKTFSRLMSLKSLKLSGNRMTYINPTCFPQVFYVEINDNPWRCDCDLLKPMYEWFMNSGQSISSLKCQSPEKFEGHTWMDACGDAWNINPTKKDTIWYYSVALLGTMSFVLFGVMLMRKIYKIKEKRLRQIEAARRTEEREALRRMRRTQQESREESTRNAPDPRELQRPPSYHEALLLPRLDASHPSLSGSLHSIASRQSTHASNPDVSKKTRVRRKRRRKSDSAEGQRASRVVVESDSSSETDRPTRPQPLESDF